MFDDAFRHEPQQAVYRKIRAVLEKEICRSYQAGDMLPPEQALATRFKVNRHTVRRATDELARAGIVEKRRGHGTTVLDPAITYPLQKNMRFTTTLEDHDLAVDSILLEKSVVPATEPIAVDLAIEAQAPVIKLVLLRLVEDWPLLIATTCIPHTLYPAFSSDFNGGSLYQFFNDRYGFQPIRRRSLLNAILADEADARHLRIARDRPLLRVKAVNVHPVDKHPVEYSVARFRGERIQLEVRS